jgi:hypothetical protein
LYGDAPAANLSFQFKIQQAGLAADIQAGGMQTTEDTWWTDNVGPPNEGTWPKGTASAAVYSGGEQKIYTTIEFVEP